MICIPTTLLGVNAEGASLTLKFRHPADRHVPRIRGIGCGELWVTEGDVDVWLKGIRAAAGSRLENLTCHLFVDHGVLRGIYFPGTGVRVDFEGVA